MIRSRFAPSPTGSLHIGNLRTCLFAYLLAKTEKGVFILRIEDTDQKREVPGAVKKLISILDWTGIKFDEGPHIGGDFGSYTQSQRLDIYKKYSDQLLDEGKAYRCFCSEDRLRQMREDQQKHKLPPRYDQKCRDLSQQEIKEKLSRQEPFVVRQKMPLDTEVIVHDELRKDIKFKTNDLDDQVLIKANGVPTYQFAVVVDDHLMNITHVVRGDDWIPSFPKNILLYQDFGWEPPKFIHLPVVLNKGGGKLSKRQGDVAVEDFRDKGYLPEAIINFCALLGWSPYSKDAKDESEVLSIDEIIKKFKYRDIGISPAVFDLEKLDYLNGYYIRKLPLDKLVGLALPFLKKYWQEKSNETVLKKSDRYFEKVIAIEQERLKRLDEIGELTEFFFTDELKFQSELLFWKKMTIQQVKENLQTIKNLLEKIPDKNWTNDSIEDACITYLKAKELKIGEYLWPMRVALTGRQASPGPFDVAEILGKELTNTRITQAISLF